MTTTTTTARPRISPMPPRLRKLMLTLHVTSSVGWLGAVAAFLALAVTGLVSSDATLVRGAYVAMRVTGWLVIVPLSLASLLTGLIQALGTTWGLLRHYWVLAKLLINILATGLLLVHMQPTDQLASAAATTAALGADLDSMRVQLVFDAAAASVVLLVAVVLSVYKPQGQTRYGWRKQRARLLGPARSPNR